MSDVAEKRVIFVPQMTTFGGIERIAIGLANFLRRRHIPVVIVCFYTDINLAKYAGWDIDVVELTRTNNQFLKAWLLGRRLMQAKHKPLLFGIKGAFNMGIYHACSFVLHFTDPPSLLSESDPNKNSPITKLRAAIAHFYTKRGVKLAEQVLTMTERNRAELTKLYGINVVVFPLGAPAFTGDRPIRIPSNRSIVLLSISRLEPSKRIDWIIRSIADLRSKNRDVQLVVVGKGSQEQALQLLASSLDVQEHILFAGELSEVELEDQFRRSDIFVMPAVQGYGLPALEALYRRIPVVLHRQSGVSEFLAGNSWVKVFDGDVLVLSQALCEMIDRRRTGQLKMHHLHGLPTEDRWAREIALICGWL